MLNESGSIIASNNDGNSSSPCPGTEAYITTDLVAGTYYVVSEGNMSYSGDITTTINVTFDFCKPINSFPSVTQNYVLTYKPRKAFTDEVNLETRSTCDVMQEIAYYDGFGRLLQTVKTKGNSFADKDIVTPVEYDPMGREQKKYLSYASRSNRGDYKTDALDSGAGVFAFYNPTDGGGNQLPGGIARIPFPYAQTKFESSPVGRIEEQGAPGVDWQVGSGHTLRTSYYASEAGDGNGRSAKQYGVAIDASGVRTLTDEGSYDENQLYITELKDENWHEGDGKAGTSQEYKDKDGRVILKQYWEESNIVLSTYYVYDDFGNLCYVLPPKSNPGNSMPNSASLNNLCYQYCYDEQNRMSAKKLPGKEWEYIVYNKLDQAVASQDGEQRKRNEWQIIRYDGLGRVIITGLWNNGNSPISPASLQALVYSFAQWDIKDTGQPEGYLFNAYPQSLNTILTVNYYDDYDIPNFPSSYIRTGSNKTRGLLTASKAAVLNSPSDKLWSVNYYDDEGRIVKNLSQHYKGGNLTEGNYDETDNSYNFTNELLSTIRKHNVNATEQVNIKTEYEYDHMGRQINTMQTIGGEKILLAKKVYNAIGQLREKRLHSVNMGVSFLQKLTYAYNERGWLSSINDPEVVSGDKVFGMRLSYNDHSDVNKRQFNGNISSISWQTKVPSGLGLGQEQQGYDYSYDRMNRLELAAYTTASKTGWFNESISYDKGGNILTLNRTGNGALIDQLTYHYENSDQSNRLESITDESGNNEGLVSGTTSYTYDDNGNLLTDNRKALTMSYNLLNLPWRVTKTSTNETITYIYDAAGRKLRKEVSGGNRDYIGGIEYDNSGNIEFIQTDEGRAVNTGSGYSYEYMLKDHLGNTRAVIKQDGSILQVPDYYAFGMELNHNRITPSPDNRYKYNGKELQTELGLEAYDYGARFYDPVIGRWGVIDGKAEKFPNMSSYVYAGNNPIVFLDPDGNDLVYFNSKGQEISRTASNTEFRTFVDVNGIYQEASMPKIIKGYESPVFQKYDYNIAAQTFIFNHLPTDQLPKTPGGNSLTGDRPDDLDPTLVKAMVVEETNAGTLEGKYGQKGKSDIMQVNVTTTSGQTDWSAEKKNWGLEKGKSATPNQSVYAGIRLLYTKGLKTTTKDGKVVSVTWRGDDWKEAVKRYNGGGNKNYLKEVLDYLLNATDPTPDNYVKKKK